MQQKIREIRYFFYSQAFADGFRASIAILLPALVGLYSNYFQEGLTISLGCMCVSLTDSPGPIVHKRNGMILASVIACVMAAATGFARLNIYTLGIEIVLASFFFSMFSVYGSRATSVGNSGILMMILTMDAVLLPAQVLPHAGLILCGGLFYTVLSLLLHVLRPYRISQRLLGDCLREIATYLSIKADFYNLATDLETNYRRLVAQQIIVHEKQEAVRELLFKSRQIVEETTAEGRRLVFTFIEAIDFFEDTTATYYDYALLRQNFAESGALKLISETIKKMADELNGIGFAVQSNTGFKRGFDYEEEFNFIKAGVDATISSQSGDTLVLKKILVNIRKLMNDLNNILQYFENDIKVKRARLDSSRFVVRQSFDPEIFANNLSLQSFGFRHALRVSLACLLGFAVTKTISYGHHSYWVLLTIAFILKPAYSLTKERNIQRIVGTFIGGAIGVVILLFIPNKNVHFAFLVLFMIGTYSFMRIRYLIMVICTTPYILILFSFLGGEFKPVVEERLLDTLIGCVLAFAASYLLFPSWETSQVKKDMLAMVRANTIYLQTIVEILAGGEVNMLEYKLARKDVYLNSANLSATFQRMLSEPKSKQASQKDLHAFVVLNHILFSNIANLSGSVLQKDARPHPSDLSLVGRKALNKLNDCRRKLGEQPGSAKELMKGNLLSAETADDLSLRDQLNFIYKLAIDLEKIAGLIVNSQKPATRELA